MVGNATKNARITKIAVLSLFLIWIAVSLFTYKVQAYVSPNEFETESWRLSRTDILEGSYDPDGNEYTLENYIDMVNDGTLYADTALHAELLYKIIPRIAFVNTCEFFHKGTAYSFYIKTVDHTPQYPYKSEVVIIPHEFKIEDDINKASLQLSLFTNGYYTGKSSTTGLLTTYCSCFQPADYYLRDVQFYCGVRNVDAPNYGDSDYSKVDDIGPILSETRINYKGVKRYVKSGSYEKLTMYMLDALFDGISDMSDVGSSLALLYKGSKEFAEWADILKECIPSQALKVYSKDNETNIRDFKSRAVQKNNDKPYYERFATVAPNDDYRDLLIDDYMRFIMKLDNSSPKSKIFIEVRYNLFGHDKSGNDFIVLTKPSGAYTEKYKTSHSNSAQFMRHYEDILFAE